MFNAASYLVWMIPALAGLIFIYFFGSRRRKAIAALMGQPQTLLRLIPQESRGLKNKLQACALVFIFIALAGPQWGVELVSTQGRAHQILVAVDVSLSMLAEDVKPKRLEKAKEELSLLLEQLKGSRVGVMAFAGEAAILCPLTTDIDAARQILRALQPEAVGVPGSAGGNAIKAASDALRVYPGAKSLVLLTDGEDLAGRFAGKDKPLDAAREAAGEGIRIFTVGIGTPEGEPIPLRDDSGNLTGYKKDRKGNTIVSRLDERSLTEIAKRGDGAYFRLSPSHNEAGEIADRIRQTERGEGLASSANIYKNRFMLPLALAFMLLLIEFAIPESRRRQRLGGVAYLLLSLGAASPLQAASAESALRRGNKLYGREEYVPALTEYEKAGRKKPKDGRPLFNAGDALYRLEQHEKAASAFSAVAKSRAPVALRADAYYNLGNIHYQNGQLREAIENYRKALSLKPGDPEAQHNLAVALRRQKNPPPPRKDQDKKDKKKPQGQKDKPRPQDQKDSSQKQPPSSQPKTRPQDQISKEDAERIMRAVSEKEKAQQKQLQKQQPRRPEVEEDW